MCQSLIGYVAACRLQSQDMTAAFAGEDFHSFKGFGNAKGESEVDLRIIGQISLRER